MSNLLQSLAGLAELCAALLVAACIEPFIDQRTPEQKAIEQLERNENRFWNSIVPEDFQ